MHVRDYKWVELLSKVIQSLWSLASMVKELPNQRTHIFFQVSLLASLNGA
jgi:hypothetical protein